MLPKHIPSLDGLRGFAAGWVVLSHFRDVGFPELIVKMSGTYGVYLFFILSGFLMGHLYLSRPFILKDVMSYTISRISRILPIFYTVILASFVISLFTGNAFVYFLTAKDTLRLLTFNGSKYIFWSIAPEVQFYVIFIGLWWIVHQVKSGVSKNIPVAIFLIALVIFVSPALPGILVFSKLHIFLIGSLSALLLAQFPESIKIDRWWPISVCQISVLAIIAGLSVTQYAGSDILNPFHQLSSKTLNYIYNDLRWMILFTGILVITAIDSPISRFLFANRLMRLAGRYSFSIYLLHLPVLIGVRNLLGAFGLPVWAEVIVAILAVVAIGPLAYYLVEMPFQRRTKAWLWLGANHFIKPVIARASGADVTLTSGS
jgi:peptidoglycan/LPS O-acetylase OafA/YrhL